LDLQVLQASLVLLESGEVWVVQVPLENVAHVVPVAQLEYLEKLEKLDYLVHQGIQDNVDLLVHLDRPAFLEDLVVQVLLDQEEKEVKQEKEDLLDQLDPQVPQVQLDLLDHLEKVV
jgi:hypothetical protein